jgi:hypothetical protein
MFSMGRDRRMPFGGTWAHVSGFKTPTNAAIAVGVLAAIPFLVSNSAGVIAIGATGTIYLSYFLCNIGVLVARLRGWPTKKAAFNLGGWGLILNILALIYGGVMVLNFALWHHDAFGDWGNALRDLTNPTINTLTFLGSDALSSLPAIPIYETFLGIVLVGGAIYYAVAQRGRADAVAADVATGEAMIG